LPSTPAALPEWARAHGAPLFAASIRDEPADFQVIEDLGFDLAGDGEHDFLWVEKVAANTDWVARQLARHAGVRAADVGYSGMKDRHAITRQWFSVPRRETGWASFAAEGVTILDVRRHHRKLRRGAHAGNSFRIALRTPRATALRQAAEERLACVADCGVPNYFGPQRFGFNGANLSRVQSWLESGQLPRDRDARGFLLSAARSLAFNTVLAARVGQGNWDRLLGGEVVNLAGSGSVFLAEVLDESLAARCGAQDVHPSGPLPGVGGLQPAGEAAAVEAAALAPLDAVVHALREAGVEASRRPLRLLVGDLDWSIEGDALNVSFALSRGAFATAVLREAVAFDASALPGGED